MESDAIVVDCAACDRSFRVKPVLAGKRFTCKCGAMIQVPAVGSLLRSSETGEVGVGWGGPQPQPRQQGSPSPARAPKSPPPPPPDDAARLAARRAYAPEGVSITSMKRLSIATVVVFLALLANGVLGVTDELYGERIRNRLGSNATTIMLAPAVVLELAYLAGIVLGMTTFSGTSANRHALGALVSRIVGVGLYLLAIFTTDGQVALDRASPAQVMYLLGLLLVLISPLAWVSFHQQLAKHLHDESLQKWADRAMMFAFIALVAPVASFVLGMVTAFTPALQRALSVVFLVSVVLFFVTWGMLVIETRSMAKKWIQTLRGE